MAFNWTIGKVKNWETLWEPALSANGTGKRLNPVTETLLNATMLIGLNSITKKNFEEFHLRILETSSTLFDGGGWLSRSDGEKETSFNPTLKEVQDHIGLTTNAITKTRKQWEAQLAKHREAQLAKHIKSRAKQKQRLLNKSKADNR